MSVRAIREVKAEPSAAIVQLLRDLLAMAERGEILAFAAVADLRGKETATAWAKHDDEGNISALVCGLERIKLRLLRIGDDEP